MIAWALANRTLAEVLILFVLVVIGTSAWLHHDTVERRLGATQCVTQVAQAVDQQRKEQQEKDERYAQATKKADDERIEQVSSVHFSNDPVFMCKPATVHTHPVPVSAPTARGVNVAPRGGFDDRPQRDLRPYINAVELKYETALAACHSVVQKWQDALAP
jgi:hypothetical protein